MEIHTLNDLQREISDQFAVLDTSCYSADFDQLVEIATIRLMHILNDEYNFRYGDELPDNDIDYFKLIEDYAI